MKRILDYIEQKKQELARSPFLEFVGDERIDVEKRFGFVPCIAPFAMAYTDINRYILRDDSSKDPLQQIINTHSREEDQHWRMYLKDLRTLGLNESTNMESVLKLLWGEHCRQTRQMVYELSGLVLRHPEPLKRLVVVEAIEGTAEVAFRVFTKAARELEEKTGKRLHYFGMTHEELEADHTLSSESSSRMLRELEIPADWEQEAEEAVDKVYALFAAMFDELLEYVVQASKLSPVEVRQRGPLAIAVA
jgi:hypothetical protein